MTSEIATERTIGRKRVAIWRKVISELRRMPRIPLIIMVIMIFIALFCPLLAPYSPTDGDLSNKLMPPFWDGRGSIEHPLGTDTFGRDILTRLMYGARISLSVSLVGILAGMGFGTTLGLLSAYYGRIADSLIMRIVDISLSMPPILIAILLAVVIGSSFGTVVFVVALLLWPRYARMVRGEALNAMQQDFIAYSRVAGTSTSRTILRHLLPNVIPTLLVLATLEVGWVIILESSLSFLGVGIPAPYPTWGVMVADGRVLIATAWWISLFPGLMILAIVLSMNTIGDWLRDRLDPKLRQL